MSPAGLAWLNGRFVPPAELVVGYADAGFASGVTLTDFCRTYRHRLFRWPDHLRRLRHDCDACHVPLPYTDEILTAAAEELAARHAASLPPGDDLAVITFATPGQLGHLTGTGESGPPTVGMHTITLAKERYRRFFTEGVTLAVAGTWSTGGELAVVPHRVKHRSRLHWWMAEKAIRDPANPFYCPGIGPGAIPVLWGEHGELADTPVGSVLVVVRGGISFSRSVGPCWTVSASASFESCAAVSASLCRTPYRSISDICSSRTDRSVRALMRSCSPGPGSGLPALDGWCAGSGGAGITTGPVRSTAASPPRGRRWSASISPGSSWADIGRRWFALPGGRGLPVCRDTGVLARRVSEG